jgi:hypothetical protein
MTHATVLHSGSRWTFGVLALVSGTLFILTSLLLDPISGLIAAASVIIPLVALYSAVFPRPWILFVLISKPVVDLAWRWKFFQVGSQGVNVQTIVALVVIILTALALAARAKRVLLFPPIILLGLVAGLSALMTPTVGALNELLRLYAGLCFGIVAPIAIASEMDVYKVGKWLLVTISIPIVLCYFQLAGFLPYEYFDDTDRGHLERVTGTYQHPLGLISFFIVAVPMALLLIHRNPKRIWLRLGCWLFIAGSLVSLAFTYHRAGMVAIAAQILLWLLLTRQYRLAIVATMALLITILLLADWVSVLYGEVAKIGGPITSDSLRGRGANWHVFLTSFTHGHPLNWLIGFGECSATGDVPGVGLYTSDEPHTDVIRFLYTYGAIGLTLYLGILIGFTRRAIRLYRSGLEPFRTIGAFAILLFFAVILLTATSEPMRYPTSAWYFFAFGALVVTQDRRYRQWIEARQAKRLEFES